MEENTNERKIIMFKKYKSTKGITLVALVVTIIILLILATISIQSLTNTGLFEKAKEARDKTQNATENQAKILNEYEDELNKYVSGTTQTQKLADKVKVGDYVSYTPDALNSNAVATLKSNLNTYSGNSSSTVNAAIDRQDLKWRVLDVQNGQVRLISETPTTSKIELYGYNGYNNAVKLIDDACSTLYTNTKLASKVQNLKIEDITKYMKTQPTLDTSTYSPTNKYYPEILLKEKDQTVNGTVGTELGVSEQTEFINQTTKTQVSSWTLKKTIWIQNMNNIDSFKDNKYYKLFINNGSNYPTYWMSSRCVDAYSELVGFNVHIVGSGNINTEPNSLCNSIGSERSLNYAFRPVITLNSNVQIDTSTSGDGSTVEQAYVIK